MTTTQVIEKVRVLEERIEEIKWAIASLSAGERHHSVVKATCGILGRNFPSGISYENRIRKTWNKRLANFNQ